MTDDHWIVIPNWDEFQHYGNRDPIWIKNYVRLLRKDEYLELPAGTRGLLHGLWMLYASSGRKVRDDPGKISRALQMKSSKRQLEALNHAGFIEFSASRPLAQIRSDHKKLFDYQQLLRDLPT